MMTTSQILYSLKTYPKRKQKIKQNLISLQNEWISNTESQMHSDKILTDSILKMTFFQKVW